MAVITTQITPAAQVFPYESKRELADSLVPLGECFFWWDEAITVSGANDTQIVIITCNLPANFSYTVLDVTDRLYSTNGLVTFELVTSLNYINAMLLVGSTVSYQGQSAGAFGDENGPDVMIFDYPILNTGMLYSRRGTQGNITLSHTNANQQESQAVFSNGMVRLLQYEYRQAFEAAPNTPILVRTR